MLAEKPTLGWEGTIAYLSAKSKRTQLELYAMDLLWLVARVHYENLPQQPSEYYNEKKDKRTAKQIKDSLIERLGGE